MKNFRAGILLLLVGMACFAAGTFVGAENHTIDREDVQHAAKIAGMNFTQAQTDSMLPSLDDQLKSLANLRAVSLPNNVPPAFVFNPLLSGKKIDRGRSSFRESDYSTTTMPADSNKLAYYSIGQLSFLLRTKQISSVRLTQFFMARLKKYAPQLRCVVTYTDSLAMQQARRADAEIARGKFKGPLQGIPFGLKDMFATKNFPTTYGTPPYRDQVINENATVVQKLADAGAVMLAKLSLGELAMDDVWYGGMTRNPWDTATGSSGSSAGPASAVSAGLVPFAIGSETWGSIVSPSTVCGVTGLRPTFGRVSRHGAMALSWSMDKIGPLCRNAEDCAMVLNVIRGAENQDAATIDASFHYSPAVNLKGMKIGYFKNDFDLDSVNKPFDDAVVEQLKRMGAEMIPLQLPKLPVNDMVLILTSEAASAFEELTLSHRDDLMVQQNQNRWPNIFRAAQLCPATAYIRASRLRTLLLQQMESVMKQVDVCIAPSLAGDNLLVTNLTGHPSIVLPTGFQKNNMPTSIVFIGQLFEEGKMVAVAKKYQDATGFHLKHPPGFVN